MTDALSRDDMEATLSVRSTMGPEIEPSLVDSFADRIEAEVQRRLSQEVELRKQPVAANRPGQLPLAITSMALGIPLTAIALDSGAGLIGLIVIWVGVTLINIVYGLTNPNRDGRR